MSSGKKVQGGDDASEERVQGGDEDREERVQGGDDVQGGAIAATPALSTTTTTTSTTTTTCTTFSNKTDDSQLDTSVPLAQVSINACEDNKQLHDSSDSKGLGFGRPINDGERLLAKMSVSPHSTGYNMSHKHRGLGLIIAYEHFASKQLQARPCARHDVSITKKAFKSLGFEIEEYWNLDKQQFKSVLKKASTQDHSERDALAIVFMSHGGLDKSTNKEFIWTYDKTVDTSELWKNFIADKCPSLAGKPKLFFIQACRGEETDKGVQLQRPKGLLVSTDGYVPREKPEDYVIPQHADMLFMWASYPGMYAFKSSNNGINGSVFLHFLSKVLLEDGHNSDTDLASMLLRVTREVAIQYESYVPLDKSLHHNKQIPYTVSTLMRKIFFFSRKPTDL